MSDVLGAVKLTGALFFLAHASFPWGVEVPHPDAFSSIILPRAQHVVSYHIILKGAGWASIPGIASTWFEAGDILVFGHHDPYSMLSAPDQPPEFDADATVTFFREMAAGRLPFVIHEGGGGEPRSEFVCGFLGCDMRPFNPVRSDRAPARRACHDMVAVAVDRASIHVAVSSSIGWRRDRRIAEERSGESICQFARGFDYRTLDTRIIRAVYEEFCWPFPLRPSDRLKEDLRIDGDDLDFGAFDIARRTGRTLDGHERNPMYGKIKTLRDVVLFFHHQPLLNPPQVRQ